MLAYSDKFLWLGFKSPNISLARNYIEESQWELFNVLISTHSSKIAALINLGDKQQMLSFCSLRCGSLPTPHCPFNYLIQSGQLFEQELDIFQISGEFNCLECV